MRTTQVSATGDFRTDFTLCHYPMIQRLTSNYFRTQTRLTVAIVMIFPPPGGTGTHIEYPLPDLNERFQAESLTS